MATTHLSVPYTGLPTDPPTPTDSVHDSLPDPSDTPRGRLKRRRPSSPRAPSPSRGHDRASGSRHRHHYRKHQRASSSPAPPVEKKNRRRSDAEPDHTFRGRGRLRSESRSASPVEEGDEGEKVVRKRSVVPSRGGGVEREGEGEELRRLRSFPNMYEQRGGRKGKAKEEEGGDGV